MIQTLKHGKKWRTKKQLDIEDMYTIIRAILNKYDFTFYHVTIEPGYYEGFYIDIENNFPYCYDSREDKRAAQKEVTELKALLIECVNTGLVQVGQVGARPIKPALRA